MRPLGLWLRSSWWLSPMMLLAFGSGLLRGSAWRWDWSWMFSLVTGSTLLASPLLATAAVVVMLRSYPRGLLDLTSVTPRGGLIPFQAGAALWLQAMLSYALCLGVGAYWCQQYEADQRGLVLPWQLLTAPAALAAAVALGLLVGLLVRSPWAVPAVTVGLFLGHRPLYWTSLPELVTLTMATGSMANAGSRPAPTHLAATVAVNLLLALAACALLHRFGHPSGARPRRWLVIAAALLAALLVVMGWGWGDAYQPIPASPA